MEKYNKFLRNIAELIEKGLFTSKDLKKEVENVVKFNIDNVRNRLDLVSREEFEIQKKIIESALLLIGMKFIFLVSHYYWNPKSGCKLDL